MKQVRETNDECLVCGSLFPSEVQKIESSFEVTFCCPNCGSTIVGGVVSHGRYLPDLRRGRVPGAENILVGEDTDWARIEVWWTRKESVALIHGRKIYGSDDLLKLVNELYQLYDRN